MYLRNYRINAPKSHKLSTKLSNQNIFNLTYDALEDYLFQITLIQIMQLHLTLMVVIPIKYLRYLEYSVLIVIYCWPIYERSRRRARCTTPVHRNSCAGVAQLIRTTSRCIELLS